MNRYLQVNILRVQLFLTWYNLKEIHLKKNDQIN